MGTDVQNSKISKAATLHGQGRLAEAIAIYRDVLNADADHIGALNLLGIALMQSDKAEEAIEIIQQGLRIDPNQPVAHFNLGTIFHKLNRLEQALPHYEKSLALNPNDAFTYNNIGVIYKSLGRGEAAAEAYRRALELEPTADAHINLAVVLFSLKQYPSALAEAKKALSLEPGRAEIHITIGNALRAMGAINDAIRSFDRAIALEPNLVESYISAGNALIEVELYICAIPYFERALHLQPSMAGNYFKLANCMFRAGRRDEATEIGKKALSLPRSGGDDEIAAAVYFQYLNRHDLALPHFEAALALDMSSEASHRGYSHSLQAVGRQKEALQQIERAIEFDPSVVQPHYNRAMILLGLGQFAEGWKLYKTRFSDEVRYAFDRGHTLPFWDGRKVERLLVWGEQGLGDQLLYLSIIADAQKRATNIVLEVEPRLIPLVSRSFPGIEVHSLEAKPGAVQADAQIPLGSLGEFFRLKEEDFPRRAFLTADKIRAGQISSLVQKPKKLTVGLSWRSINREVGTQKTAALLDFLPLLRNPSLHFVDLQYGNTADERIAVRNKAGIEVQRLDEIDNYKNIDGLAALIEACDFVVTVSNTTAHLAGALGKPVWVLVPHGAGRFWYWFNGRKDSPWYPGARVRKQQIGQSWGDLVESIIPEISEFAKSKLAEKE